jgi:predicted DNA-binding protein YlxM (UPF0122 family)
MNTEKQAEAFRLYTYERVSLKELSKRYGITWKAVLANIIMHRRRVVREMLWGE